MKSIYAERNLAFVKSEKTIGMRGETYIAQFKRIKKRQILNSTMRQKIISEIVVGLRENIGNEVFVIADYPLYLVSRRIMRRHKVWMTFPEMQEVVGIKMKQSVSIHGCRLITFPTQQRERYSNKKHLRALPLMN